ncbi:putative uncharacterized protein [Bacteroides sp. CAG:1076]|nr:putative uncharacterized protein [Bacteroides sp. CAG:1076]
MIIRIALAIGVAILLAIAGVNGNAIVLQTLFTVLGIVFSISMSLLVSFSLTKILNKKIRDSLRISISHTRNMLLLDFSMSTIVSVVALIWDSKLLRYTFKGIILDIMLIGVMLIATSLIYEIYNFRKLHKLHTDIEDAIIAEETKKAS